MYIVLYILYLAIYIIDFIKSLTRDVMSKMIEFSWIRRHE
jgi:hypothetical protein